MANDLLGRIGSFGTQVGDFVLAKERLDLTGQENKLRLVQEQKRLAEIENFDKNKGGSFDTRTLLIIGGVVAAVGVAVYAATR